MNSPFQDNVFAPLSSFSSFKGCLLVIGVQWFCIGFQVKGKNVFEIHIFSTLGPTYYMYACKLRICSNLEPNFYVICQGHSRLLCNFSFGPYFLSYWPYLPFTSLKSACWIKNIHVLKSLGEVVRSLSKIIIMVMSIIIMVLFYYGVRFNDV